MRAAEFVAESRGCQDVAEGSLNEYRNTLYDFVKSKFPTWPEYVLKDFLYQQAKTITNQEQLADWLERNKKDFGQVKWRLEKLPITLDIFTPKTQRMIKQREGGNSNPFQVPRDAERHAQQLKMIQQQGVRTEPIIVAKLNNGYDLIEGWHRTIQHLQQYPEGYTGPAWVAYGATYTSESKQGVAEGSIKDLHYDLQDQQWDAIVGYVINGLKKNMDIGRIELNLYKYAGQELFDVDQALEDRGFRDIADLANHIKQHNGKYVPPTDFGLSDLGKGVAEGQVPSVRDQIIADVKKHSGSLDDYFVRFTSVDRLGYSGRQTFGRSPDMDDPKFDVDYIGAGHGRPALWFYPLKYWLKTPTAYAAESPYAWLVKLKPDAWLQPAGRSASGIKAAPEGKQRVGILRQSMTPAAIFFRPGFDVIGRYYDYASQHQRHGQVKGPAAAKPSFFDRVRGYQ